MSLLRQRQPREENAKYLAAIRLLPCLICLRSPSEAAHVRMRDLARGKTSPGIGRKPDDRYAVPLCHEHHLEQHRRGERIFWETKGIDPIAVALELYANRNDQEAMIAIVRLTPGGG